jgi:hypothetical protein
MTVRYQLTCLKYHANGRRNVLVEWHHTAADADAAEALHTAQQHWDVIVPPIPVMVRSDRPTMAKGGWNLPEKYNHMA